jgi:hypothetical protein
MDFDTLKRQWSWKPIRNCPGRYILTTPECFRPQDLAGENLEISEYRVEKARDTVLVARIEGGGLISYTRKDGSVLHTLNTSEGFRRKLADLGIEFD